MNWPFSPRHWKFRFLLFWCTLQCARAYASCRNENATKYCTHTHTHTVFIQNLIYYHMNVFYVHCIFLSCCFCPDSFMNSLVFALLFSVHSCRVYRLFYIIHFILLSLFFSSSLNGQHLPVRSVAWILILLSQFSKCPTNCAQCTLQMIFHLFFLLLLLIFSPQPNIIISFFIRIQFNVINLNGSP